MKERSILLAVLAVFSICFPANGQPWLGSGTENDPYLIEDANDMQAIGADPYYWDAHFKLMKSIDLENRYPEDTFNIIGNLSSPFTGVFDGNGHVVSNFIYEPGPGYYDFIGIFGYVDGSGAKIKNLGLKNPTIGSAADRYVGALVGYVNDGEILNCYVEEVHIFSHSADRAGGLVGMNYGTINKCYTTGIVGGFVYCGGLVGLNVGIISDSYSTASVTSLPGSLYAIDHGGLVGRNVSSINRCYSAGLVESCNYDGGLVGRDFGTVVNSFWDIETSGQSSSGGGIPKTTAQLQTQSTFTSAGWDFTTPIWKMTCEGCDYPKLWYQDAVYIILSPPVLDFQAFLHGPNPASQDLLIRNFVPGSLNWQIAEAPDCDWLTVTPESGNSSDSFDSVTVSVDVVTPDLPAGIYSCTLTISDPNAMNSPQTVQVNLEVLGPEISVWPDVINFQTGKENPHPASELIYISNSGYVILEWEINIPGSCGWLSAYPMTGASTGEPNQVVLTVDSGGMDYGTYNCQLTISDPNATNNPQTVEVNLDILRPVIELSDTSIEFSAQKGGLDPAEHLLSISNIGYDTLNWQITTGDGCEWLSVYPMMGQCGDEPNEVTLTVDANGLDNAFYNCLLTVSDPVAANNPQTVDVLLHVYTPGEIHVPAEYPTIQAAVDAANNGDVIILQPQRHNEDQDYIDFRGKSLTVRSTNPDDPEVVAATVIEGVTLYFDGTLQVNYVLEGVTIVGGWGIYADDVSLTVQNCSIRNCMAYGMRLGGCNAEVIGCTIADNGYENCIWQEIGPSSGIELLETTATVKDSIIIGNHGTGITAWWSDVDVTNCLITGNIGCVPFFWFASLGGGINNTESNVNVSNCSLTGNEADVGGGIFSEAGETIVKNSILWKNEANVGPQICLNDPCWPAPPSIMEVYYSDVQGGEGQVNVEVDSTLFWGQGNINADPIVHRVTRKMTSG